MTDISARGDDVSPERDGSGGHRDRGRAARAAARHRVERHRITLLVVALGVIVVVGVALGHHPPAWLVETPGPPPGLQALGLVLVAVGLATAVVGFVRARRAKALGLVWNSPTALLSRAERKRLLRSIRADDGVHEADQQDAVALAHQLARQDALLPAYGGMMLYFIGQSLLTTSPLTRWPVAAALVLFAVGLPLLARDARRARLWLDHHDPGGA